MDVMPCSTNHLAKSEWSLGPRPRQMPTHLPWSRQALMDIDSMALTAGSRSSKSLAKSSRPESQSRPRVSWVRSLEPMEKPSYL